VKLSKTNKFEELYILDKEELLEKFEECYNLLSSELSQDKIIEFLKKIMIMKKMIILIFNGFYRIPRKFVTPSILGTSTL